MKWKDKSNGKFVEVIDDDKGKRYFVWVDDPEQDINQWDLIYGPAWEEHFEKTN